jgi:hypothetical protein
MTEIIGELEVLKRDNGKWQLLSNPMIRLDNGKVIKPLAGFILDFGSIPQAFWSFLGLTPLGSPGDWAFLVHDWLYYLSRNNLQDFDITREEADLAMLEILLYCGVDTIVAHGVYTAVRSESWRYWGNGEFDGINLLEGDDGYEWFRE